MKENKIIIRGSMVSGSGGLVLCACDHATEGSEKENYSDVLKVCSPRCTRIKEGAH